MYSCDLQQVFVIKVYLRVAMSLFNMNFIELCLIAALLKASYMLSSTLCTAWIRVPGSKSIPMGWLGSLLRSKGAGFRSVFLQ